MFGVGVLNIWFGFGSSKFFGDICVEGFFFLGEEI